ncbi:hypothetical protein ACFX2A_039010 [Malus domestica]
MKAEFEKLKGIGFVREVNYPMWVINVVLVKKNSTKESLLLQKVLLIDSTVGCELLSFMDAYSGYNQILMNPSDQEHTAFTTDRGLYCYKVLPFGLKNAGATYQRLVNSMFAEQIGKRMEVYVDDMLAKSKHADQHITNLSDTVTILKRFISKATDRCAPFFKVLKGSKKYITWTDKCADAFKNLKDYMSKAPLLSKPEDGNVERPVYYASKALQDADTRYSNIEKLALALILQSPNTSGRMIKLAIALGEFDISYQPKPAKKGQVVTDFIADFTYPVDIVSTPKEGCGAGLVLTTPTKWQWSMLFISNSRRRTMRQNMKPS